MKTFFVFLRRNKLYTSIQIFGLSVALGFVLLLASYARTEYRVGRTSPSCDSIYAIGMGDCLGMTWGTGRNVLDKMPVIKSWTRLLPLPNCDIVVDGQWVRVQASAVDPSFLNFLNIPLLQGNPAEALRDRGAAVVSESFALRMFGTTDVMGKSIVYHKNSSEEIKLCITGLMPDMGPSDVFDPIDLLVSAVLAEGLYAKMDNFGSCQTFVRLAPGAVQSQVEKDLLKAYMDTWDFWRPDETSGSFLCGSSLVSLSQIYFSTYQHTFPMRQGNRTTVLSLLVVALVLLLSALFNYVNLTMAQTGRRVREMAIRQLVGESQWSIFRRYLSECLLFTSICFALGCLVAFALRPLFNKWLSAHIVFSIDVVAVLVVLGTLLLISLFNALAPSLMVLRFKPIDVVRGDFRLRGKMYLGRVFMVIQSSISMVIVSMGLCMAMQMHHMLVRPTGYHTKGLLSVTTWDLGLENTRQRLLRDRLLRLPQVESVGMAAGLPTQVGHNGVQRDGEKMSWLRCVNVDTVAFRLLGFRQLESYSDPLPGMGFVTEETRDRYGVSRQQPYIEENRQGSVCREYTACGVLADYNCGTAMDHPLEDSHNYVKLISDDYPYIYNMLVKVRGDEEEARQAVCKVFSETARELVGLPLTAEAEYLTEQLREDLTGTRNVMFLVLVFMVLSLVISALGLVAMSVYFTTQQGRQIALRRVFGYQKWTVIGWLSVRYVLITLLAVVLAIPMSVWMMRRWLQDYAYVIPFPWYVLPLAACIILTVAVLSILWQTWSAASCSPVHTLRSNE